MKTHAQEKYDHYPDLLRFSDLQKYSIGATDGELGQIDDVYFDDTSWRIRYFVVDTIKWLPSKKVLLAPEAVVGVDLDDKVLKVALTKEQVKDSPHFDEILPVSRQYEITLRDYYNWPAYWIASEPMTYPFAPRVTYGAPKKQVPEDLRSSVSQRFARSDQHLQSCKSVKGFVTEFVEGDEMKVQDFWMDIYDWNIPLLELAQQRLFLAQDRKVVPTFYVQKLDFEDSKLELPRNLPLYKGRQSESSERIADQEVSEIYDYYFTENIRPSPMRVDDNDLSLGY